jgi:serine protease AprX
VLPQLLGEAGAQPDETFRVIVQRRAGDRSAEAALDRRGYPKLDEAGPGAFVAAVRGRDIAAVGRLAGVAYVSPDAEMVSTAVVDGSQLTGNGGQAPYERAVGADAIWAAGTSGAGVGIAVVDSGVNTSVQDFKGRDGKTRVAKNMKLDNRLQPTTGDDADYYGHGTMVAGIALGNSWNATNADRGKYVGIAPDAKLITVRTGDDKGKSYVSGVVNAIHWVIDHRKTYNIRVLNLSMTSTVAESATTSVLDAAVELAWFNGVFVVVAAGNGGPNSVLYPPGNDPFVVSVGAADTMGTVAQGDDTVAAWSSYGTTQDGRAKPELVAPGRHIVAPLAYPNATLPATYPDRILPGQKYFWASGTSMAAPIVAGIAALAFAKNPGLSNDGLKWLMTRSATPLAGAGAGAGEVNATALFAYAGTIGLANRGLPISKRLVGPGGATTYSGQGPTGAGWTEGGWDASRWAEGGWDASAWAEGGWDTVTGATTGLQAVPWSSATLD